MTDSPRPGTGLGKGTDGGTAVRQEQRAGESDRFYRPYPHPARGYGAETELSAARLYTLVYQTYSVIISLYRLRAERHEAVQTRAKDPEGPARAEKTPVKINGISKYIIGYRFTYNRW